MMIFRTMGGSEIAFPLQTQFEYAFFIVFWPTEHKLAGPGPGTGPRPGIPTPQFFDGAPRTPRPRGGPSQNARNGQCLGSS